MENRGIEFLSQEPIDISGKMFAPITMGDLAAFSMKLKSDMSKWVKEEVRAAEQQTALVSIASGNMSGMFSAMNEPVNMLWFIQRSYNRGNNEDKWKADDLSLESCQKIFQIIISGSMSAKGEDGDNFRTVS